MSNGWLVLLTSGFLVCVLALWWMLLGKNKKVLVAAYGDILENRILSELVRDFSKKFPHIHVVMEWFPYPEFSREVLGATRKGTGPDVVVMDSGHYPDLVFDDILEPLNTQFLFDQLDINQFYPQVVDRFYRDGFMYAVPRDTAPICMVYYNKRAFDEAGIPYPKDDWNWDAFVDAAKKTMKILPSGRVERWGFIEGWNMLEAWVYNAGGSFVDYPKCPTRWTLATDHKSRGGLQFRSDLIHVHKVMPPPAVWSGSNDLDSVEMFVAGKVSMILCGLWKTPRFREIRDFQWDAAMIPCDPTGNQDFCLVGSAYGILHASPNKEAAWKFVKYASGEDGARRLSMDGLSQPALMKVANSDAFLDEKDPRNKRLVLAAMKHGKYSPLCRNWSEVKAIIEQGLDPVWTGKSSVTDALERLRPVLERNPPVTRGATGGVQKA